MLRLIVFIIFIFGLFYGLIAEEAASDLAVNIYHGCLKDLSTECIRPKAMEWAKKVSNNNVIQITNNLFLEKISNSDKKSIPESRTLIEKTINTIDDFIESHQLVVKVPSILKEDVEVNELVSRELLQDDIRVPLSTVGTGRSGFMKKVIIPFLLGLKFKTAVLLPLALALTALKTWKALTLGLLSLVLSGAMVIFKFTKPKQIINYEILRVPPPAAHIDHIVEHGPPATYWDHHPDPIAYHTHH